MVNSCEPGSNSGGRRSLFRTRSPVQFLFGGTGSATGTESVASITTNDVVWECSEWTSGAAAGYEFRTLGSSGACEETTPNCFALLNGPRSSRNVLLSTAFRQSDGNVSNSSVTSATKRFGPQRGANLRRSDYSSIELIASDLEAECSITELGARTNDD